MIIIGSDADLCSVSRLLGHESADILFIYHEYTILGIRRRITSIHDETALYNTLLALYNADNVSCYKTAYVWHFRFLQSILPPVIYSVYHRLYKTINSRFSSRQQRERRAAGRQQTTFLLD